jgi:hypothetical protein
LLGLGAAEVLRKFCGKSMDHIHRRRGPPRNRSPPTPRRSTRILWNFLINIVAALNDTNAVTERMYYNRRGRVGLIMNTRKREGGLNADEKRIVKALLAGGMRNQDIQALVNTGRNATINSARITGVKKDQNIKPASEDEVLFYKKKKQSYDWQTGLNLYDDERLIRAREAMILAVDIFNSPSCCFKTEIFAVLANIAWTYLLHAYYEQKSVKIVGSDNRSLLLSQMLGRHDCPLSSGAKNNLTKMKGIRDDVEHLILRRSDLKWAPLFQACCLNFESFLVQHFGERLSLQKDLSFALQFAKLDIDQITALQKFDIPEEIEALDARLQRHMSEDELADLEFQFRVVYTLDNAAKGKASIQFIKPGTEEAKDIHNVLLKYKIADEEYPYKPSRVAQLVTERSGKKFLISNNTQAWLLYKARPTKGSKHPEQTNREFCIYHPAHADYTYSEKWIDFLCERVASEGEFKKIKAVQPAKGTRAI